MGIEMADNMSTIQNMQQTETTMTSTGNYWLIMQNRYGIIDGGDYGDLGVAIICGIDMHTQRKYKKAT